MTFTRADLLADISDAELTPLTEKLVNYGDPDPVATTIAEEQSRMERFIHRYDIEDAWLKNLLRPLVLWSLYKRLGGIPDKRQKAYDEVMKELREIRDGKFKDIPLKDPLPSDTGAGKGKWGGDEKLSDSRFVRGTRVGS